MICLDTSILIEYFRKAKKENSTLYNLATEHKSFAVSAITEFEILCGCKSKEQLDFWEEIFSSFRVLPFDKASSKDAAKIYQELRRNNKKHFERIKNLGLAE